MNHVECMQMVAEAAAIREKHGSGAYLTALAYLVCDQLDVAYKPFYFVQQKPFHLDEYVRRQVNMDAAGKAEFLKDYPEVKRYLSDLSAAYLKNKHKKIVLKRMMKNLPATDIVTREKVSIRIQELHDMAEKIKTQSPIEMPVFRAWYHEEHDEYKQIVAKADSETAAMGLEPIGVNE